MGHMSRHQSVPSYRLHKQSGQAIVTLSDGLGNRHDVLLGAYGSAESRAEYARVIAEWEANGRRSPPKTEGVQTDISVNELILAYLQHAEQHYRRPDGTETTEVREYKAALRPLKELYGHTEARAFGPLGLKAVRQRMVDADISRGVINQRIGRVRRVFKWAVENELIAPSVLQGLQAVRGLQKGRSQARDTAPVQPVAEAIVLKTLPYLTRPVRAMVQVQLLTGARPGEICVMRACDIETSGPVWLYRPGSDRGPDGQHKTAHHGHQRLIAIGPKAQELIRPFLKLDTQAYFFSPREAMEELRSERRRKRVSKVQPSQEDRRRGKPKRSPGQRYTPSSYAHAVSKACEKAGVPSWHPHQLRHTAATKLRREYGLDVARAVLGHRSPQITELYAELDTSRAAEVMEKLG
jgi:integrase